MRSRHFDRRGWRIRLALAMPEICQWLGVLAIVAAVAVAVIESHA